MPEDVNETPPAPPSPASDERTVPLAELLKERKRAQEAEAKLKEHATAQLSEVEKLQARLKELEPLESEVSLFRSRAEQQRDSVLKGLTEKQREKALLTLDGLPLAKQLAILETFATSTDKTPPANPQVTRQPPVKPTESGAPKTYDEWAAMPKAMRDKFRDIVDTLP